ncbi:hypothetical protein ACFQZQ_02865 [Lysobacter koreensis]|uniref:GNAT family N-acetyltransferase n=1 Tax=Lysobacter koreensis TaxID=266122 RepID=A0ABW2YN29_9GAMM
MDLLLTHPDSLRSVWTDVRAGLEQMPAEDWIAEDVYHAIKTGDAALHIAVGDAGFAGFLIMLKRQTEFTKQPTLHIWLAYNHGGADVIAAGESLIKQTAANIGATKITFGSPRLGWAKRYPLVTATYEIPKNMEAI